MVRRYAAWIFWNVLYGMWFWRKRELTREIIAMDRTRRPWWKFSPNVFWNKDGRFWEVYFTDESCYSCWGQKLSCELMRAQDGDHIVGLILYEETRMSPPEKSA